ncbi:hypothetical protein [Streptomyces sp. NPDC053755]|uniref:hypothetical protein n=1 Tax=Streptomyces sp. NPDC053755 TaxID=3155815 RepID=UPI003430EFB6
MASLTGAAASAPVRGLVVELLGLSLQFAGREAIAVPVPAAGTRSEPFTVKEGTECRAVVRFRVEGASVTGLRVRDVRSRSGSEPGAREVTLGDFRRGGPYELALPPERVPSGPRARGPYEVYAELVDGDGRVLDRRDYRFEIRKSW